jgi:prolyl-tRNA synthetase
LRPLTAVATPNRRTIEEVTQFLKVAPRQLVKTLLYATDREDVAVLVRGDHEVNGIKVKRLFGVTELELAGPEKVRALTGAPVGFAGPVGLKGIKILADQAVRTMRNFVVGANQADTHFVDANIGRDFPVDLFGDLRNAQAGDQSPRGDGTLQVAKGIEVGHVFMLGTKYSQAMSATFLDTQGKELPAVMGCYGIGVGRTAAASIEQNHDAKGIIWPVPIAPFHVHLLPLSQSQPVVDLADRLYHALNEAGIEVLWDDRDERAGVKFNDADLIGAPLHLVLGEKSLARGEVELKTRKTGQTTRVAPDRVVAAIRDLLAPSS